MYSHKRKLLSQNFLYSRKLVKQLVDQSSIGSNDLVLEIGPGKGIITEQLVRKSRHVIAIELDTQWCGYLHKKFEKTPNFTLFNADAKGFPLPYQPYKVFANIPFAIEGELIRKLIDADKPPIECSLVIVRELAERLCAFHRENVFSVTHKPWFDFSIEHDFRPTDFTPVPKVNASLFRFKQKAQPLLPWKVRKQFQAFVNIGFGNGDIIRNNLRKQYSQRNIEAIFSKLKLPQTIKPSHLSVEQWVGLYQSIVL